MKVYKIEEAKQTILKRKALQRMEYSPLTIQRTEEFFGAGITPPMAVEIILNSVEDEGDSAMRKWSEKLDGYKRSQYTTPETALKAAWEELDPKLQKALQDAAARIRAFHEKQPIESWISNDMGGQLGQRVTPVESVGVYVPGGTAPLPSSLLMSVIPAKVAGVKRIYVATPPEPAPSILAALPNWRSSSHCRLSLRH